MYTEREYTPNRPPPAWHAVALWLGVTIMALSAGIHLGQVLERRQALDAGAAHYALIGGRMVYVWGPGERAGGPDVRLRLVEAAENINAALAAMEEER